MNAMYKNLSNVHFYSLLLFLLDFHGEALKRQLIVAALGILLSFPPQL